jgi:hypothetical protein
MIDQAMVRLAHNAQLRRMRSTRVRWTQGGLSHGMAMQIPRS